MASISTGIFERLFFTYMVIALLVGGAVIAWLFYSMWRFRARPGDPRPLDAPQPGVLPVERGHVLWVYVMAGGIAAIMFGLAFSTISAVHTLEEPPHDEEALYSNVTGFQFGWRFNYTGAGGVPFNVINEFTVPVDTPIVMNVTSTDVWHNFAIPDYRMRVDAIPGEVNLMWFQATEVAETHVACVQICGAGHAIMRANVHVLSKEDFARWMEERTTQAYATLERGGSVSNLTLEPGGSVRYENATRPTRDGFVAVRVTNADAAAHDVRVGDQTFTLQPGGVRLVHAHAPTRDALRYEVS